MKWMKRHEANELSETNEANEINDMNEMNDMNDPADLAPAHDFLKILVSLWRQLDFMWETTMKKNIRFTVVCNPYRVLCFKTRRTIQVAFSLHRMRDLTASPVAVSKSNPVCSHLHW